LPALGTGSASGPARGWSDYATVVSRSSVCGRLAKLPGKRLYPQLEESVGATVSTGEGETSVSSARRLGIDASAERTKWEQ
jgi:hypothetical protein